MEKYIKAQDACEAFANYIWSPLPGAISYANSIVEKIPAADVVEVVRCGECKHWRRCLSDDGKIEYYNFSHCEKGHHGFPNFFCADGEMRNDG